MYIYIYMYIYHICIYIYICVPSVLCCVLVHDITACHILHHIMSYTAWYEITLRCWSSHNRSASVMARGVLHDVLLCSFLCLQRRTTEVIERSDLARQQKKQVLTRLKLIREVTT